MTARLGGHVVVDQLVAQGVEACFGVPGASYLAVLDGFCARCDRIRCVTARHEATASHTAEAWGELIGRPAPVHLVLDPRAITPDGLRG